MQFAISGILLWKSTQKVLHWKARVARHTLSKQDVELSVHDDDWSLHLTFVSSWFECFRYWSIWSIGCHDEWRQEAQAGRCGIWCSIHCVYFNSVMRDDNGNGTEVYKVMVVFSKNMPINICMLLMSGVGYTVLYLHQIISWLFRAVSESCEWMNMLRI